MHAVNDIAMSMKIVCWGSSSSSRKFCNAGDTALFDENQFHAAGTALQMRGNLRDVLAGHGSVLNCTECKEWLLNNEYLYVYQRMIYHGIVIYDLKIS